MHSTFRMFTDLARFGALMLVILFGFALAFYAMFGSRSATLPDGSGIMAFYTYASSLLTLFASMLGNFDFSVSATRLRQHSSLAVRAWLCSSLPELTATDAHVSLNT